MKLINLLSILSLSSAVATPVQQSTQGPPGYGVDDIMWEVDQHDGPITVRGTLQDVAKEISKRNVDTRADITARERVEQARTHENALLKRDEPTHYICKGFTVADAAAISDGIRYLDGVAGKPARGPGPGSCGQVSCSHNSAIWWCNDATVTKTLGSFSQIGDAAHRLIQNCYVSQPENLGAGVSGQAFFTDDWNVIVQKGNC